jgi:hypothetical protein
MILITSSPFFFAFSLASMAANDAMSALDLAFSVEKNFLLLLLALALTLDLTFDLEVAVLQLAIVRAININIINY